MSNDVRDVVSPPRMGLVRWIPFIGREKAEFATKAAADQRKLGIIFWIAFSWIALLTFGTLIVDYLPIKPPNVSSYSIQYGSFSAEYWLGTDMLGRDIFSRIMHGAVISLQIAFTAPFVGLFIGLVLGMCAGYFRGNVDRIVSILIDSILAFPNIVAAMTILFFAGASMPNLIGVIAFYTIPQFTRIARANTLAYAEREFVLAARAQGASHMRILTRELFPNIIIPLAAYSLLVMSFTIVLEGGLSFLGVGLPPPTATWGSMIAEGVEEFLEDPKITFLPAGFMFLTILSLNLMGDRLRSLTDVRASNV